MSIALLAQLPNEAAAVIVVIVASIIAALALSELVRRVEIVAHRVRLPPWLMLEEEAVFQFGSRKYRRGPRDVAATAMLLQFGQQSTPAGYREPLWRYRTIFRQLVREQPIAGLVWCLAKVGDPHTRRLAVWLLGRCGDSRAIDPVSVFLVGSDRKLRIAVARALERLHARAELQAMADRDLDPWIRQFAASKAQRSFARQLAVVVGQSTSTAVELAQPRSNMKLVVLVEPTGGGKRPKSADTIRRLLEQIRRWVHGSRSVDNGERRDPVGH